MPPRRNPSGKDPVEAVIAAGQRALEETRFEDAVTEFRAALRIGTRSAEEEALVRCRLSEALEKRSLYREQLEVVARYEKPQEFSRLSERLQMLMLIRLGWGYSLNDDIPRAIASFNQAMQIAERLSDAAGMGACSFGLGRAYRNFSEGRIARDHYSAALKHYRQTGDWRRLAESYINIGYITAYEGDYRSGVTSLNQALTIIGDKDEHDLLGRAYMYIAISYDHLGSTSRALESWEKCIDHFSRGGNATYLAVNRNNYADKLLWLGEWDRAEQMLQQSIDALRTLSPVNYGGALDTMAQLCLLRGDFEEADRLLAESLGVLSSTRTGEWCEVSTRTTLGRCCLLKNHLDEAIGHFNRAIEICSRAGDARLIYSAQLLLADALLQKNDIDQGRAIVNGVRSAMHESPNMLTWGLMMRIQSKMEAADGFLSAAIQSLAQSTSSFEIRGNMYECAVNRVALARLLEKQHRLDEAIGEVEQARAVFERLGARSDEQQAADYLHSINSAGAALGASASLSQPLVAGLTGHSSGRGEAGQLELELASVLDGFTINRLVQASVSRDLLLHEMASIARDQAQAGGAFVVQVEEDRDGGARLPTMKVAAAVGLDESRLETANAFLAALPEKDYAANFVFSFSGGSQTEFLLRIIDPASPRFISRRVTLEPLLRLVEQGLEAYSLKVKSRRTQVFDLTRRLTEVELPGFICASRAMTRVIEQIHKIRSSDVTVLITGESGTGKELIARAVHAGSTRRYNTFVPFNCSASPREMTESQLFGYRKGAFTGATENNPGIVRAAERGTIFLDEIGDLPLELQPKLLRFLQEGEIQPLGENEPVQVDVRVVAATNSKLEKAVAEGRFREDLFHRLNVIRIHVPPLRERREEIPALLDYYLKLYQEEAAKNDIQLSEEAVDLMVVYDWPGNVRQLCNEVRRLVAYTESGTVAGTDGLSPEIVRASTEIQPVERQAQSPSEKPKPAAVEVGGDATLLEAVKELERRMIRDALRRSDGSVMKAAKELGISRKGLYMKMGRFNFEN
ncbi:MAG TPA: sigma 54-interacting transcriptional regulator [Blastocatellia bacterium]|nr:sigma 54-interacting transcriptional regulator [Blastocatellia bacterium]